ncbi:MAG TPA: carboxypeptidase-like regulatory domain-containing protein [Nitrospirota bacterium]|nr:carboxypeptidase-like regulatory domain-containing protein [Nitrospirota bacterium]
MKKLSALLLSFLACTLFHGAAYAHEGDGPKPEAAGKPAATKPVGGFEGIVVRDSQVLGGARVYAYSSFADLVACRPFAASDVTSNDIGKYELSLPAGKFYLAAKRRQAGPEDGPLAVGDYYSFQGSNPIAVVPGKYTHVGFSMVCLSQDVKFEASTDPGAGSIEGVVTYCGEPVPGANVILYLDGKGDFRGQGYTTAPPTGSDGSFRMDFLPESDYFLIARKRATGKGAGPLTEGDYFGYYVANPLPVKAGKVSKVNFGVVIKASDIGKDDSLFRDTGTHVTGRILDKDGKPAREVYAFAYKDKVMAHKRPEYISRAVDGDGKYVINVAEGGTYYIGARSDYGDTPGLGEWYGRYEGTGDHSVKVETGKVLGGVDIVVEQILP